MNKDWAKLKQSKDGIPTYDSLYPYILLVLKDRIEKTNKQISKAVFDYLDNIVSGNVENSFVILDKDLIGLILLKRQ